MELSIVVASAVISHNVTDETPLYSNIVDDYNRQFNEDEELADGVDIFTCINTFKPTIYEGGSVYTTGDVVYKDHYIQKVTAVEGSVIPVQPEHYTEPPTITDTFLFTQFTSFFSKIATGFSGTFTGFTKTVGNGVIHKLFMDNTSITRWSYQYTYPTTETYWEEEVYNAAQNLSRSYAIQYIGGDGEYSVWYEGEEVATGISGVDLFKPYETIITSTNGTRYLIGKWMGSGDTYPSEYYGIKREVTKQITKTVTRKDDVIVYTSVDNNTRLLPSFANSSDDANNKWIGRCFVIRGSDLYVRTAVDVGEYQEDTILTTTFEIITALNEFPSGYWVRTGLVNYLKPFDGKNYNYFVQTDETNLPVRYALSADVGESSFDTVALSGFIAANVDVIFKTPPDGLNYPDYINDPVLNKSIITGYVPQTNRDVQNRLPPYQTTTVLYSSEVIDEGGMVSLALHGTSVRLGTLMLGLNVNAGFTNLEFTNEFNDYSPVEKDDFTGHVTYIEGVKQQVHTGTVDVPIENYDMMNRLMTSIGGKTVILNGSGSKYNLPPDSDNDVYASTMIIGRIKDFKLKTKVKNKRMGGNATYSFIIEESI